MGLIIGVIAVLISAYMVYTKVLMKNGELLDVSSSNDAGPPLTEEQKRLLAFGGILFYYRGEGVLSFNKPTNSLGEYIEGMKEQWGITNPTEAKETLGDLLALKRSDELQAHLLEPSKELSVIQKNIAEGLEVDQSIVEQVKTAYAWDICRAVSLAKWCYWVGYLTEEETWEIITKAQEIAVDKGESWAEYTISFLLGRTVQGFDLDQIIVESQQLFSGKGPFFGKVADIDIYTKYKFKG